MAGLTPIPEIRQLGNSISQASQPFDLTQQPIQLARAPAGSVFNPLPQLIFHGTAATQIQKLCEANPNRISLMIRAIASVSTVYWNIYGAGGVQNAGQGPALFPIYAGENLTLDYTGEIWLMIWSSAWLGNINAAEIIGARQL